MIRRALLALCATAAVAHAQPNLRKEAGEHFARGEALQARQSYREAIAEYEQAYASLPHANALFNIGYCFEQLGEWQSSADYYERYLEDDRDRPATDTSAVKRKIRELRAKAKREARQMQPEPQTAPPHTDVGDAVRALPPPPLTPPSPDSPRFHGGISYGIGIGDSLTERYVAHGGVRIAEIFDVDAVGGSFGKNDYAVGGMLRVVPVRGAIVAPFGRAALTVGFAKQDASSMATWKFPIGLEVGGGVTLGARGAFEVDVMVRYVRGGWDANTTTADSYVNDAIAVGVDLGITLDMGVISGGR